MNQNDFIDELTKIGIKLNNTQLERLERYYELLIEYNKVMNLTGITNKEEVYLKHYYDSLTLIRIVNLNNYENLCDIGTGAGFPGIVLKIVFPNLKITLVDSLNKRINFLNIVIKELGLSNIEALHCRAEEYAKENCNKFDLVTSRAVAATNILLEYCIPIVKVDGYFIAMKANIENEPKFDNASKILNCILEKKCEFLLPREKSIRTLLLFKKCENTNKRYPRKYSEIKKRPL